MKDDQMVFLNTKEVAAILGVSLPTVRHIFHNPGFPTIRAGRKLIVNREAFLEWAQKRHI